MGASFRKIEQIIDLAGCDLLTISPDLLETLQKMDGELTPRLTVQAARASSEERVSLDEKAYRWLHNQDPMAVEKLSTAFAALTPTRASSSSGRRVRSLRLDLRPVIASGVSPQDSLRASHRTSRRLTAPRAGRAITGAGGFLALVRLHLLPRGVADVAAARDDIRATGAEVAFVHGGSAVEADRWFVNTASPRSPASTIRRWRTIAHLASAAPAYRRWSTREWDPRRGVRTLAWLRRADLRDDAAVARHIRRARRLHSCRLPTPVTGGPAGLCPPRPLRGEEVRSKPYNRFTRSTPPHRVENRIC